MSEPQITVKPYYHTGAIPTKFHGGMTITVTRMHDTSKPEDMFFGSVQDEKGEELLSCHNKDGNKIALLCHSFVTVHGFDVLCTCNPPVAVEITTQTSSEDC